MFNNFLKYLKVAKSSRGAIKEEEVTHIEEDISNAVPLVELSQPVEPYVEHIVRVVRRAQVQNQH